MLRKKRMKQSRQENICYLIVWCLLFLAPLQSLYVRTISDGNVVSDWSEVFLVWQKLSVYLALFLVHNFLLAPLLLHSHRRVVYFSIVTLVIAAFAVFQYNSQPDMKMPMEHRPPMMMDEDLPELPPDNDHPALPPDDAPLLDENRPPQISRTAEAPPRGFGERNIMAIAVLILMWGANLGIKAYFRSRNDQKRLAELERENLEQQLEYLRYQINPHFFMNTLNNIHALVDIDPEKAKGTILELSKMMRFVLYEGNKQGVPLSREMEFIRHYVALMQLRYTEKVHIALDLPSEVPDRQIPPLILITFIENAFKHGVSYQQESFIGIKLGVENGLLTFECRNSMPAVNKEERRQAVEDSKEKKGGVGLANVQKRLNLLYGGGYSLHINNGDDVFSVELTIPLGSK
jgi:hypothetical protein